MKKQFICLANSYKHSGRCIAGIELSKGADGLLRIVRNAEHNPRWIQPISQSDFGELNSRWVQHIRLGDLVEIEITEGGISSACFHQEKVAFNPKSINVVDKLELYQSRLTRLAIFDRLPLFNSKKAYIEVEDFQNLKSLFQFIKIYSPQLYWFEERGKSPQEYLSFNYNDCQYDLPLTDIEFVEKYLQNNTILEKAKEIYICVSIGLPVAGKMHKIVAGIFWC